MRSSGAWLPWLAGRTPAMPPSVMRHLRLLACCAALAAAAGCAGAAAADSSPLLVVSYTGSTPTVTLAGGAPVGTASPPGTLIPAGTYTVEINVSSMPADFQIVGPGVNFLDNEPSSEVYTISFAPGSTYSFEDVTDPSGTLGYFSTSTSTAPTAPAPAPTLSPTNESNSDLVGSATGSGQASTQLDATVSAGGIPTLLRAGKPVTTLKAGRYSFVIADRDPRAGFNLEQQGKPSQALTGGPFTGRRTLTLTLTRGAWSFYASPSRRSDFAVTA